MKKALLFIFILLTALVPLACGKKNTDASQKAAGSPTATVIPLTNTPTVSLTTVCGFTPVKMPDVPVDGSNPSPAVLRSVDDWNTFYSGPNGKPILLTPVPPPKPPIDFKEQMLIVIVKPFCPISDDSVGKVCVGPSGVTVTLNEREVCEPCNDHDRIGARAVAVAVPQSNQDVIWNTNNLPCVKTNP